MTREELKAHCEKQMEMCEMWAISKGEKPSGKAYEEHKLILELLEQEPKRGHWIGIDEEPHEVWECDHCGFVIDGSGCIDPYDYRDTYKFCPNCGADMREVEK